MDREAFERACGLATITSSSSSASRPSVQPSPPVHGNSSSQQQPILVTTNNHSSSAKEKSDSDRPVERNNNHDNKKRNRHSRKDDAYQVAYRGFTFTPVPSTGRPGTPHRFFAESYAVEYQPPPGDDKGEDDSNTIMTTKNVRNMRVHRHANGLCVVATNGLDGRATGSTTTTTARSSSVVVSQLENQEATTMALQWRCQTVPDLSAAQKRKRVATMLKQKPQQQQQQGAVRPTDPVVTVTDPTTTQKETTISATTYPAVVFGSVLEINTELTLDLLRRDPLLKGYLAVILPSGPFPPLPPSTFLPKEEEEASIIIRSDAAAEAGAKSNA